MKQFAALTLLLLALVATSAIAQSPAVSSQRALAREILEELIAIPTTADEGATPRAAEAMAGRLLAAGFAREDVRVVGPDPRTANLIVRYRGRDPRARPILLMAHIDVVPARREDWSTDPWRLVESDGWWYGRGVHDNKAGAAILVTNFSRLKREQWQPVRYVIVLLTGDEETSQRSIQWLLAEHRPLIDAELAFNTDSGGVVTKAGRPVFFNVQASEKIYADYQLEVTDSGGHSSLARPGNPIYTLSAALTRIGEHQFPVDVSEQTRLFLERSASVETGSLPADMRAVAAAADPGAIARLSKSPFYNAQLRTTCVATRVEAGHANNALPQLARAVINCRILPGLPGSEVETTIRKLSGPGVTVTVLEPPVSSPPSPVSSSLLERLGRLTAKHWPNVPVVPVMSTGATDGMYTRSAGIATYGVSGLEEDPDDVRAHGKDERVRVDAFYRAMEFWYELTQLAGRW